MKNLLLKKIKDFLLKKRPKEIPSFITSFKINPNGMIADIGGKSSLLPRLLMESEQKTQERIWRLRLQGKNDLREWIHDLKVKKKINTRLYNQLKHYPYTEAVEDITKELFMQYRGNGIKSWNNFCTLKRKYLKKIK